MNIHLIAIGGAVMHNLAIALHHNGHRVTGSDDEIYNPAKNNLNRWGLLPAKMGWDPDRIHTGLDVVILGMHARQDNPELIRAQSLDIPIKSFPQFIYSHAQNKKRVVIAGSHGKTTTTSMIMHVLRSNNVDFDYLVGAQLEGFDTMVKLSDAPLIIIEGDEYLSSPIDRRPKFLHYKPHIAVVTGIAWDHINVFPDEEEYIGEFSHFISAIEPNGLLIHFAHDEVLSGIVNQSSPDKIVSYSGFKPKGNGIEFTGGELPLNVFGKHNLENLNAAYLVCRELGISDDDFASAVQNFKGAANRLQLIYQQNDLIVYRDFAHAPSKVQASVRAVKGKYPNKKIAAFVELHTYSSLQAGFIPRYKEAVEAADEVVIFYNAHTLEMKKMPPLDRDWIREKLHHKNLKVVNQDEDLFNHIRSKDWSGYVLLMMSSGNFGKIDLSGELGLKNSNF